MSPTIICPEACAAKFGISSCTVVTLSPGSLSKRIPNPVKHGSERVGGGVRDAKCDLSRPTKRSSFSIESFPDWELVEDWKTGLCVSMSNHRIIFSRVTDEKMEKNAWKKGSTSPRALHFLEAWTLTLRCCTGLVQPPSLQACPYFSPLTLPPYQNSRWGIISSMLEENKGFRRSKLWETLDLLRQFLKY